MLDLYVLLFAANPFLLDLKLIRCTAGASLVPYPCLSTSVVKFFPLTSGSHPHCPLRQIVLSANHTSIQPQVRRAGRNSRLTIIRLKLEDARILWGSLLRLGTWRYIHKHLSYKRLCKSGSLPWKRFTRPWGGFIVVNQCKTGKWFLLTRLVRGADH